MSLNIICCFFNSHQSKEDVKEILEYQERQKKKREEKSKIGERKNNIDSQLTEKDLKDYSEHLKANKI